MNVKPTTCLEELLGLRQQAMVLHHSKFTQEAEKLLDIQYPDWRKHWKKFRRLNTLGLNTLGLQRQHHRIHLF